MVMFQVDLSMRVLIFFQIILAAYLIYKYYFHKLTVRKRDISL
jgi:hypothetical protein